MIVPSVSTLGPARGRGTSCGSVRSVVLASCGDLLAGPAPRSLARDHDAALEDLAAPDPPGLAAVQRAGQAGRAHRAVGAEGLGELQLRRALGEPQPRVLDPARQRGPPRSR